jgi:secreted trypsin-like serine protease
MAVALLGLVLVSEPAFAQEVAPQPGVASTDGVGGDVVGGDPIPIEEAPWQVSVWVFQDPPGAELQPAYYWQCGGSFISERVVITAAHCLYDGVGRRSTVAGVRVGFGTDDLGEFVTGQRSLWSIAGLSRHPRYETSTTDDIAYLRLASPITSGPTQHAIDTALPGDEDLYEHGDLGLISGWGSIDEDGTDVGDYPDDLHGGEVPLVGDEECADAYEEYGEDHPEYRGEVIDAETMVCAGDDDVDACFGDSGGPLWVSDGGDPLLVGATSFGGELCADPVARGVYTELAAYADMTEAHLAAATSPPFSDVTFGHPFLTEIWNLEQDAILGGYPDGSYRSGAVVTRQAMSAFMYRLAGEPAFTPPGTPTFEDVGTSHPFSFEIEWMADEEISTGFQTPTGRAYRPAAEVTRQAMSAFMYRLAGEPAFSAPGTPTFDDVTPSHPFYEAIEWMADEEITTGYDDGTYRPSASVTRQSMAAFLYRLQPLLD